MSYFPFAKERPRWPVGQVLKSVTDDPDYFAYLGVPRSTAISWLKEMYTGGGADVAKTLLLVNKQTRIDRMTADQARTGLLYQPDAGIQELVTMMTGMNNKGTGLVAEFEGRIDPEESSVGGILMQYEGKLAGWA